MKTEILMPSLSPTMEEGSLAKWYVSPGDKVKPGDIIADIETDKALMEYESIEEGTIVDLVVKEGTENIICTHKKRKIKLHGSVRLVLLDRSWTSLDRFGRHHISTIL